MSESRRLDRIEHDAAGPDMDRLGERIAGLSRPTPPANLAARTMAHIQSNLQPAKRVFWMWRPITNPVARMAACAAIVAMLFPLTDFETGANLGNGIERRIGSRVAESIESMVDRVLISTGGQGEYSQSYLDSFMNVNRPNERLKNKRLAMKEPQRRA
jgi:hypothetical protein